MASLLYRRPACKPTRKTARKPGIFGAGILRSTPTYKAVPSFEDEACYTDGKLLHARDWDRMAEESRCQTAYESGYILPLDVAEGIAATRCGHEG